MALDGYPITLRESPLGKQVFHLDGKSYTVKARIQTNVRTIAADAEIDEPLKGKRFRFMRDLFAYHPRAESKIGSGIETIVVRIATRNRNNREFWIKSLDSDVFTDISWPECLNATSSVSEFRNACRLAVKPHTQAFADAAFANAVNGKLRCPINGSRFDRDHAHVDHDDPWRFTKLVEAFIAQEQIDVDDVEYDGMEHGSTFVTLRDSALARRFITFHNRVAVLRVVSKAGNLSRG